MGVMLHQMLNHGNVPYRPLALTATAKNDWKDHISIFNGIDHYIAKGNITFLPSVSDGAKKLIMRHLTLKAIDRPTMEDLLKDEWMTREEHQFVPGSSDYLANISS